MSRNRDTTNCDCGYTLQLRNATTRPMAFEEYMRAIEWEGNRRFLESYLDEFYNLIVCQVQCPECGSLYAMWLSYSCRSSITGETIAYGLDTSYWYAFNDEPSEKDMLSQPLK